LERLFKENKHDFFAPIFLFFILYALLELIVYVFNISTWIFPSPTEVFSAFINNLFNLILPNLIITVQEILIGFIIGVPIGIIVAAFITAFKILDIALTPYIILLVTTPMLSFIPLLMVWLGFGMEVKIIAVIVQTFPIVMMNSATGFNNVDELKLELMTSLGANRLQRFFKVILPSSLPHVFTGIKLGGIFATITAITAEFVGGNAGIGYLITTSTSYIRTSLAFSSILSVAIIGIALYFTISFVEKKIVTWKI